MTTTESYTAADIQVLTPIEGIRKRPGMYVGDLEGDGLYQLLWEVLGNAIDEHLRGGGVTRICIDVDGERISVDDDGRGIPGDAIAMVMTTASGGSSAHPHVHLRAALQGAGVIATCALSSELIVEAWHAGRAYAQQFARGLPTGPLVDRGATQRRGTRVTFVPDFTIMARRAWDVAVIARRCRELAALLPALAFVVDGETFAYPGGLVDHVVHLAGTTPLIDPLHVSARRDNIGVELVFAWVRRGAGSLHGFVNCCPSGDGSHVSGLFAGVRRVLVSHCEALRRLERPRLQRHAIAAIHVMLDDPRFGNPSRAWLARPDVAVVVRDLVETELVRHFDRAPALLDAMLLALAPRSRSRLARVTRPRIMCE